MLDTDCVSDLNRLSNEVEERAVVKRFAALAALQYHRHYNLASLRKLPPLHVTPQPDFECEVSGWESVRLEVVSLRDENVVRVVKYLDSEVISTSDPSVRIVTNKALKSYPPGSPIELLCFSDGLPISALDEVVAGLGALTERSSGLLVEPGCCGSRANCTVRSDRRTNPSLENLASIYSLERVPWPEARRGAAAAIRNAIVFGVEVPGQDDSIAAACRYVLVALLQRLEAGHAGLADELGTGIQSDRAVAFQPGALRRSWM
jgi:hypothetical protein